MAHKHCDQGKHLILEAAASVLPGAFVYCCPWPQLLDDLRDLNQASVTPDCEHLAVETEAHALCHRTNLGVLQFLNSPKLQMGEGVTLIFTNLHFQLLGG